MNEGKPSNRSAMEVLRTIDRGNFLTDFDTAIREIAQAIEDNNGGAGEITLKIKIKSKASTDALQISGDISHKVPKRSRIDAIFFFDEEDGGLSRRDKRQPDLPSVVEADQLNDRRRARADLD